METTWIESAAALWEQMPGQCRRYWLRAAETDEGSPVEVPIALVTGRAGGPRVALVAGVHGDEVEGQFALQWLASALDPAEVQGTLLMVLCANPLAAIRGQRRTPQDGRDLNRVFPGDSHGSLSYRVAAGLFDLICGTSQPSGRGGTDFLMTLHGWTIDGEVLPYVEYPGGTGAAVEASRQAAIATGLGRVMPLDWHPGLLPAAAVRSGVPAIEMEVGGLGQSRKSDQALYRKVILRVLRHLGAVEGGPSRPATTAVVRGHHLYAPAAGMLSLDVELGSRVAAGQRLARLLGLDGGQKAELGSPIAGEVGAIRRVVPVQDGDHLLAVFETLEEVER